MEGCDIFLCKIKNKNKEKHCLTKRHKYFSKPIINKCIVRNPKIDKFKDIFHLYNNNLKKKFDNSTVCVMWKENDALRKKCSVLSAITLEKPFMFKPGMIELPIVVRVSTFQFLDTFDRN